MPIPKRRASCSRQAVLNDFDSMIFLASLNLFARFLFYIYRRCAAQSPSSHGRLCSPLKRYYFFRSVLKSRWKSKIGYFIIFLDIFSKFLPFFQNYAIFSKFLSFFSKLCPFFQNQFLKFETRETRPRKPRDISYRSTRPDPIPDVYDVCVPPNRFLFVAKFFAVLIKFSPFIFDFFYSTVA